MFLQKALATLTALLAAASITPGSFAQQPRQLTTADYAHAESFLSYNVQPLVFHTVNGVTWLPGERFVFRDAAPDGVTFTLVDPAKGTKSPAFDHVRMAAALTAAQALLPPKPPADGQEPAASRPIDPHHLPITDLAFPDGSHLVEVTTYTGKFRCDLSGAGTCTVVPESPSAGKGRRGHDADDLSPDKTRAAFIRNYNLWVRDVATGKETQLTTDGVKDYGYATDNAGWTHSDRPILVWSPDSKKIATFQQDQRKDGDMYLVSTNNGHPTLKAWKYPLVGDKDVTMIERVILDLNDLAAPKLIRLKMPPDQHRSTLCDDISCRGGSGWDDVQWSDDAKHLAFVSTSRDHKQEWLRVADASTGDIREVMGETVAKFFESGNGKVNWQYLPHSNEILWFSERDNWGQMYLYDLTTGALKNQITHGEGNVTQVLSVDEKTRTLYFLAVGKEQGSDPYFSHFYSIHFDGSGMKLLTPENADHAITPSLDGRYFVDVYSTATQPQTTVVRDHTGKLAMDVTKQDITKLLATGWVPPTPIIVKARDGKTDLYGYMFKPLKLDPAMKYPIVNNVYPGPQTGSCGSRAFSPAHSDHQALAELGFIVVCIDGTGTPWRSKSFHEAYYGDMGDNTIPDQVSGMKDLATQFPFIDLERSGIYGHSGGGNATAAAMFHYPDFFKVGIAESGNHDNREYEDDWGEKWAGLEVKNADGKSNYDSQANQNFAKNLKGHLLLAHGTFDDNVPPNNTLIVVDALIKANKDFDLLMIPNAAHGYASAAPYMTRRRWDYFVRYLAGNTPPHEYQMKSYAAATAALEGPQAGPHDDTPEPNQPQ
jgi:dipeptidyl-peptidase-4